MIKIRQAELPDLQSLLDIEQKCFRYDRLSRRSFRHFLDSTTASLLVAASSGGEGPDDIAGYVLTLFHKGSHIARIYSIALSPAFAGLGVASHLLQTAEDMAQAKQCLAMRLEVSQDNSRAIALYERSGYRHFGVLEDYYEDHQPALRYQKTLRIIPSSDLSLDIPYYPQKMDFSCGPASVMMALAYLRSDYSFDIQDEIEIWREATTVFMTSGHGGCGPHGLALAAVARGLRASIFVNETGPLFMDGVRREEKKRVLELVHEGFLLKIAEQDIPIHYQALRLIDVEAALERGEVPLVLISTWHFDKRKAPHWVAVTAIDRDFIYIHDPDVDPLEHQTMLDSQHLPIARNRFEKMARFGARPLKAAVLLKKP